MKITLTKKLIKNLTIKIAANYSEIIQCIVRDYKETVVGYCAFLEKHQDTIKEIFGESKSDNLRTLKIWLTDFERVYKLWIELDLPLKDIDQVFYNFGAVIPFDFGTTPNPVVLRQQRRQETVPAHRTSRFHRTTPNSQKNF